MMVNKANECQQAEILGETKETLARKIHVIDCVKDGVFQEECKNVDLQGFPKDSLGFPQESLRFPSDLLAIALRLLEDFLRISSDLNTAISQLAA